MHFKKGDIVEVTQEDRWCGQKYSIGTQWVVVYITHRFVVVKDDRQHDGEGTILKYNVTLIEEEPPMEKEQENRITDLIDNQPHYKNQGIEPIVLMKTNFSKEEFAGFLQGNVLKYMLRYKDKNGLEDLKKAKTYLTWLIDELDDDGVRRSVS